MLQNGKRALYQKPVFRIFRHLRLTLIIEIMLRKNHGVADALLMKKIKFVIRRQRQKIHGERLNLPIPKKRFLVSGLGGTFQIGSRLIKITWSFMISDLNNGVTRMIPHIVIIMHRLIHLPLMGAHHYRLVALTDIRGRCITVRWLHHHFIRVWFLTGVVMADILAVLIHMRVYYLGQGSGNKTVFKTGHVRCSLRLDSVRFDQRANSVTFYLCLLITFRRRGEILWKTWKMYCVLQQ